MDTKKMNYHKLAFDDTIKQLQQEQGSRTVYENVEKRSSVDGMGAREVRHIESADSFYVATTGSNGYPYIQHRGGPKGFLKVLDSRTLGFLDFSGNNQYITLGNLEYSNKVALILMDYARKKRLKMYAETETITLTESSEILEQLRLEAYEYRAERAMLFHIKAFDWNCPQHITKRLTDDEVQKVMAPKLEYIAYLEEELKKLRKE